MKISIFLIIAVLLSLFTLANAFIDDTQSEFNLGTYLNTTYNGSSIILQGKNLSGEYRSQIFDAGAISDWNNLSWNYKKPTKSDLYTVDAQADVWSSPDGITWTLIKDDYNGGDGNGATYMTQNFTESLFILFNQDIWASDDLGSSWNKINDDYNGGSESNNGLVITSNLNNHLFVIEGDQDVWRSTNSGLTWTKVNGTDFNGGNGNVFGITVNNSNHIITVDAQADVWSSPDGITWTLIKDDYNGADSNAATDLTADQNDNIYILNNQDVWRSTNSGLTWTKMSDDFNGAGDGNNGQVIISDTSNNLYIVDGSQDIYESTNQGSTWSIKVSNFNDANGNVFGIVHLNISTNISLYTRSCNDPSCSGEAWNGPYTNSTLTLPEIDNRFFQYKVELTSEHSSLTSLIFNVTISYIPDTTSPTWITEPQNQSLNQGSSLSYNIAATDNKAVNIYFVNDTVNFNINNSGTIFNITELLVGTYNINISVNDTSNNLLSKVISIIVNAFESNAPIISLIGPTNSSTWSSSQNVTFQYNVTDESTISNCSLLINSSIKQTSISITKYILSSFYEILPNTNYNWSIQCTDQFSNLGSSPPYDLIVNFIQSSPTGGSPSGDGSGGGSKSKTEDTTQPATQPDTNQIRIPSQSINSQAPEPKATSQEPKTTETSNQILQQSFLSRLLNRMSITGSSIAATAAGASSSSIIGVLVLLLVAAVGIYEERKSKKKKHHKPHLEKKQFPYYLQKPNESLEQAHKNLEKMGFKIKSTTKSSLLLQTLRELKKTGNIEGAVAISREGLIIASEIPQKTGAEKFSATSALMIKSAETALNKLGKGKLNHIILNTNSRKIIARTAGDKAILVCLVKPRGNIGLMLLEIDKVANKVANALK